jgi:hypothetical protein
MEGPVPAGAADLGPTHPPLQQEAVRTSCDSPALGAPGGGPNLPFTRSLAPWPGTATVELDRLVHVEDLVETISQAWIEEFREGLPAIQSEGDDPTLKGASSRATQGRT